MWRALFLAIGIFLMLFGVQCLGVERFTLKMREDPPPPVSPFEEVADVGAPKKITPAPWTPWSLMASGAVICLYSFTIPRRVSGN